MSNQPLRDLIHRGESRNRGYNDYNGGTYTGSDGQRHIRDSSQVIDFSGMTLGEVQARQHRGELFAVGLYQVIPDTMDAAAASLDLDPNQRFTPELQDRIFSEYLIAAKRPDVRDYITGKAGATLETAEFALSEEWASFGDPRNGGASHYPPPNVASVSTQECGEALQQMRKEYQANLARGLSPDAAFKQVTIGDAPLQTQSRSDQASGFLMSGDRGASVKTLQTELQRLGYTGEGASTLATDGDFGGNTQYAVETFQRDHHLTVDGKVGPQTGAAIRQALATEGVRTLQGELNSLGYTDAQGQPLAVDGAYGAATRHAVEAFQHDHQLSVDGIVGPRTQEAIEQAMEPAAKSSRVPSVAPMNDPASADFLLYQQSLAGVSRIDADMGRATDPFSRNLAATLAAEAKAQGLTRIDAVVISEDGARTFAVQNDQGIRRYADVTTAQAVKIPIEESSVRAARMDPHPAAPLPAAALPTAAPAVPTETLASARMA